METRGETDLPAQQARAQAPPWFPQAHADHRRAPGGGTAPRQGPQAPVGLSGTVCGRVAHEWRMTRTPAKQTTGSLSRVVTLKRRAEFQRIRKGARWATSAFVLEAKERGDREGTMPHPRFG